MGILVFILGLILFVCAGKGKDVCGDGERPQSDGRFAAVWDGESAPV